MHNEKKKHFVFSIKSPQMRVKFSKSS